MSVDIMLSDRTHFHVFHGGTNSGFTQVLCGLPSVSVVQIVQTSCSQMTMRGTFGVSNNLAGEIPNETSINPMTSVPRNKSRMHRWKALLRDRTFLSPYRNSSSFSGSLTNAFLFLFLIEKPIFVNRWRLHREATFFSLLLIFYDMRYVWHYQA